MLPGKVLIVGIDSVIGSELARVLTGAGESVVGTTRRRSAGDDETVFLDLSDDVTEWRAADGIAVAVLAAAMDQQQCLRDPELSRRVNVDNMLIIARSLMNAGARVVFLSTNLVFDCAHPNQPADSVYRPLNVYAAEKAAVEQGLLAAGSLATICRLAKVLTGRLPLVAHWLTDLAANRPISAFNDLNVSPVSLGYVTEFLLRAIRQPQGGIFQISGAQELSYCALAKALAKRCGSPASLVHCRSGHEAGIDLPAFPRHPSLDGSRTRAIFGLSPQPLPDLLDELVISFEEFRVAIKS